jgi:sialidase-1
MVTRHYLAIFVFLIGGMAVHAEGNLEGGGITVDQKVLPILKNQNYNEVLHLSISGSEQVKEVSGFDFEIADGAFEMIKKVQVFYSAKDSKKSKKILFGEAKPAGKRFGIEGSHVLTEAGNHFFVSVQVAETVDLGDMLSLDCKQVLCGDKAVGLSGLKDLKPLRLGVGLRQHQDDGVHTYRIPGLATTCEGTLIGVYDIRRNGSVDLQADVDVGLSRSTDGGMTWEPMKIIMDMKEWGGLPEDQNGIGDPAVLVDRANNTIWVAAVWAHGHPGQRNWSASKPGMEPEETSQFVLVKSEDDGVTWSEPINITKQIKQPEWQLLLQGPGKGISMKDGTLVFPAQFKDKDEMPHSTIIWSKDHGETWHCGTGAKSDTTEAQVVELNDGSLMLNMRDNRNRQDKSETNGRSIAVTADLGKTWTKHATSRGALREPTCMASLIKEDFMVGGEMKGLVLFSNPDSKKRRQNITIKASLDDAQTWPEDRKLLLDQGVGRGYSCMTRIDESTVGILYEGSKADLVFQAVKVEDLLE